MKAPKAFIFLFILFLKSIFLFGQQGEWTWMKGDSALNSAGHYGIQGIPSPLNYPPGMYEANGWVDLEGNFWLFGGLSWFGNHSDLWKYDVSTNIWTWVHGPGCLNQPAVYGIQGIPSPANSPGDHHGLGFVTWVDLQGDLWLMGGSLANGGSNDLWRYHIASDEWTWMKGSQVIGDPGYYGTKGIADPANNPPGRDEVRCGWTDDNGDLWLFGGATVSKNFNDLWKYDISTNLWTWQHGSSLPNQPGIYGVQKVPAPLNTPGSRWPYAHWKDSDGNFWIFGGGNEFYDVFNDLWMFDPIQLQWTWMSGSNLMNQDGQCLGICQNSASNMPGSRYENSACWKGACDVFYFYGGRNPRSSTLYSLSDLWCYDRFPGEWTFVKGTLSPNLYGIHGSITFSDPANMPRSLYGSCSWTDQNGNMWLFGGRNSGAEFVSELWRYVPDDQCPPANVLLTAGVSRDTVICRGESTMLSASGGNSYHWSPNMNISNPNVPNPYVAPEVSTTYTVEITYQCNSSVSSNVNLNVHVEVLDCSPIIPNILTPNGDGMNDIFKVIYKGRLPFSILIFNRWGMKLFESKDLEQCWDGKFKGSEATAGVYFYLVKIGEKPYSGTVTLMR